MLKIKITDCLFKLRENTDFDIKHKNLIKKWLRKKERAATYDKGRNVQESA